MIEYAGALKKGPQVKKETDQERGRSDWRAKVLSRDGLKDPSKFTRLMNSTPSTSADAIGS